MTGPTGHELEDLGAATFRSIGFTCVNARKNVRLTELDPGGPYTSGDNLELDYLIPAGVTCIIGEITSRGSASDIREKYARFRRQFDLVSKRPITDALWTLLGVPDAELVRFRAVRAFRGLAIVPGLQSFDVRGLTQVDQIPIFFEREWGQVREYAEALGPYAKPHFLSLLAVGSPRNPRSVVIDRRQGLLEATRGKIAGGDTGLADIYTFVVSPYHLLPMARVYRRDDLPDLSSDTSQQYQRPLMPDKLRKIRQDLIGDPSFVFPNSILAVLSPDCSFDEQRGELRIPETYGSIRVVDGQHRLFSYANTEIEAKVGDQSRIMVTAIRFRGAEDEVTQSSARTFVEINTNQTRVDRSHLDAIAYPVLGLTDPRALAAQVILKSNVESGRLRGLFITSQTSRGVFKTTTIVSAIAPLVSLEAIQNLTSARRGARLKRRRGYERLFGQPVQELVEAPELITAATKALGIYFNHVAETLERDWPRRRPMAAVGESEPKSSLEFAKMLAGFIRLFDQFLSEGLTWGGIQAQLEKIRTNLMRLRRLTSYDRPLLEPADPAIPDAQQSISDDFKFLQANRKRRTSIAEVRQRATAGRRSARST